MSFQSTVPDGNPKFVSPRNEYAIKFDYGWFAAIEKPSIGEPRELGRGMNIGEALLLIQQASGAPVILKVLTQ